MNQCDLLSKPLEQLSTQQTPTFKYDILDVETRIVIQQRTNEIKALMRRTAQDIIDIGQKLIEVKQHLGHGSFRKWVECEFNWSVSATAKFMQVAEQFKCVNFTHLNITASALYLIAAPSTPKEVREEVLEHASNGENMGYTKVKAIVRQYKKTVKFKPDKLNTVDISAKTTKCNSCTSIEPAQYKTSTAFSATEELTGKEADVTFENKPIITTSKDVSYDNAQIPTSRVNLATISPKTLDAVSIEVAMSIKNLTPEQLGLAITHSANNGLSDYLLQAIITASQQALNARKS